MPDTTARLLAVLHLTDRAGDPSEVRVRKDGQELRYSLSSPHAPEAFSNAQRHGAPPPPAFSAGSDAADVAAAERYVRDHVARSLDRVEVAPARPGVHEVRHAHRTLARATEAARFQGHPFVGRVLDAADEVEGVGAPGLAARAALRYLAELWEGHLAEGHGPAALVRADLVDAARLLLETARDLAPTVAGAVLPDVAVDVDGHAETVHEVRAAGTDETVGYVHDAALAAALAVLAA